MVGRAKKEPGGLDSLNTNKDSDLQITVIPVLLYGFETWTLNLNLKRRIDVFGNRCLRRIMGYRWYDFVSKQRLFHETDSRPITSIIRQRQLRLYGHVARACMETREA